MYTLCVIDMQNYFWAAKNKETIENVKKEIIKAKRRNYPVIYVKYDLSPWTNNKWDCSLSSGLAEVTRFYKNKYTVIKKQDDGANEVFKFLKQKNLPLKLRMTGINSNVCVMYTVETLVKKYNIKIDIVKEAINSFNHNEHTLALREFDNMKNVRLI